MKIHGIDIFADKSFTPHFEAIGGSDIVLRLSSGNVYTSPSITIFFADLQEATNFKNQIIQSWEAFLRKLEKEKPRREN